MSWFQVWQIVWQTSVVIIPVLLFAGFLWLKTQFPTKIELTAAINRVEGTANTEKSANESRFRTLEATVSDHGSRLTAAEKDLALPPSRHTLNNSIAVLQGSIHSMERGFDDIRRMLETTNQYVHTVIEQHMVAGK